MNEFKCGNCGAIRYEVDNVVAVKCMECDSLECYGPLKANKAPVAEVPCSDGLCAELSLMLDVFNSCIETKTLPGKGSPCQEKIIELLKRCGKEPTALKVRGA